MNTDKIFYGAWGSVIIMIGVAALLGMYFELGIEGAVLIWLFLVGLILLIAGIFTAIKDKNTATLQMIVGMILSVISIGLLAVYKELFDLYITIAIIIIVIGLSIVAIGLVRKR